MEAQLGFILLWVHLRWRLNSTQWVNFRRFQSNLPHAQDWDLGSIPLMFNKLNKNEENGTLKWVSCQSKRNMYSFLFHYLLSSINAYTRVTLWQHAVTWLRLPLSFNCYEANIFPQCVGKKNVLCRSMTSSLLSTTLGLYQLPMILVERVSFH